MNQKRIRKENIYISTIDSRSYALAETYGLGVELADYCTAWNLDEHFPETDAAVRSRLKKDTSLILHGPFSELFPCAVDPLVRAICKKRFLQTIEIAKSYACRKIVFHGGYHPYLYFPEWYRNESVKFWKELLLELKEDVTICVENVLEEEPGMLLEIIQKLEDPRIRMCLDIGHVHVYAKTPLPKWISLCHEVIAHFHIHNNDGTYDSHGGLSEGTIPVEEILDQIAEECENASITLEMMDVKDSVEQLLQRYRL